MHQNSNNYVISKMSSNVIATDLKDKIKQPNLVPYYIFLGLSILR